ncbi:MAG: hypothetical protein ING71_07625 [Rhodocyclaceae bacterium]|jgi:hypothetical protein|nr:hypothetical protein [Rhodocyclaceae bacterium]
MAFFILEPEVAGGFGPETVLDRSVHPPRPTVFNYEFDGWLGDPLVETVANFVVTLSLRKNLEVARASGIAFGDVKISKSGEFEDLYPDTELPEFSWMQVSGSPGFDDFGLNSDHRLVVSGAALKILTDEGMNNCEIEAYPHS